MVDQIERQKACWVEHFLFDTDENLLLDTDNSSLQLQRTVYRGDYSVYQYPDCLSTVKCYLHRRLISTTTVVSGLVYVSTQAALARVLNIAAGRTGSVVSACPV